MAKVLLLIAKFETGFQSFGDMSLRNEPRSRYFQRIGGMESVQKYP